MLPLAGFFCATVEGEWSEHTRSISPASRSFHSSSVVPRPHRRRAFEDAAQPFEVFAGDEQVLRAGLDGGFHAAALRLGDFAHDARQRGVADVDGSPRPLRLFENHVHGFFFRDRRMRREEVRDAGSAFCAGFGL